MSVRALATLAVLAIPAVASAQNAEQLLREAEVAFQNLELGQAARLYTLVLNTGSGATETQRDTAQLYLGISLAQARQREDALSAFRAFIRSNPCSPAPAAFGALATEPYNQARSSVVAVGLCGFEEQRLSSDDTLALSVAVTRASLVSMVLQDSAGETVAQMMMELDEGSSMVFWAGRLDPSSFSQHPTEYSLLLRARDQAGTATGMDSVPVLIHASSVDTLSHPLPLSESDLLLEERPMSAAYGDLGKGLFIGAGVAAASMLSYSSLGGEYAKAVAVGGTVSLAGIVALLRGSSNRTISDAQLHNETVRSAWEFQRDSVVALNSARLAARQLVIAPAGETR